MTVTVKGGGLITATSLSNSMLAHLKPTPAPEKKVIIGLDISTKAGVAVLDCSIPGEPVLGTRTLTYPKKKGVDHQFDRWYQYEEAWADILMAHLPHLRGVVVEGYGFASQSLSISVELGTHFKRMLHRLNVPWLEVAPTKLKKFVTGKGVADKNVMMLEAYKRFGIEAADDNQYDAACLAYFGACAAKLHHLTLPKPNLEAVIGHAFPY